MTLIHAFVLVIVILCAISVYQLWREMNHANQHGHTTISTTLRHAALGLTVNLILALVGLYLLIKDFLL